MPAEDRDEPRMFQPDTLQHAASRPARHHRAAGKGVWAVEGDDRKEGEWIMKGYKGFDKDLKCRGKQYEAGKTYEEESAVLCESGMHFCERALDCFEYYPPADSRYCAVEAEEATERDGGGDSKRAAKKLTVVREVSIQELAEAAVMHANGEPGAGFDDGSVCVRQTDWSAAMSTGNRSAATNTGDWSAAMSTGDRSAAMNTGDYSAATNTGDYSAAQVTGADSIAIATGLGGKASGELGGWLFLAERDGDWHILDGKAVKVDGEKIKPGVFYTLRGGKIVEAE
jgi:hypothetical protein